MGLQFLRVGACLTVAGCGAPQTSGPAAAPQDVVTPASARRRSGSGRERIELDGSFDALREGGTDPCFFMPDVDVPGTRAVELHDAAASVEGSLYCGANAAPFADELAGRMPVVLGLLGDIPLFGGDGVVSGIDVMFGPSGRLNNDNGGTLGTPVSSWMDSRTPGPHLVVVFPPQGVERGTLAATVLVRNQDPAPRPPVDAAIVASMSEHQAELARCLDSADGAATIALQMGSNDELTARAILTTLPPGATRCIERVTSDFVLPAPHPAVVFVPITSQP